MRRDLAELVQVLDESGVFARPVCLHASMRSMHTGTDADELIDLLLRRDCTLLVPSFTYFLETLPPLFDRPSRNGMNYPVVDTPAAVTGIFDPSSPQLSTRAMGALVTRILARPERIRGNHPLNSFTALGPMAGELISPQDWTDVYAPLRALNAMDGVLLLIGTDLTSLTFVHYAEQLAGRSLFIRWAVTADIETAAARVGSCSRAFNQLEPSIEHLGQKFTLCGADCRLFKAAEVLPVLVQTILQQPEITRCADQDCLRCRDAIAGGPISPVNN